MAGRAFYVAHMLAEEGVEGAEALLDRILRAEIDPVEALLEACMLAERHGCRFSDCTSMSRTRARLALEEAAPAPS